MKDIGAEQMLTRLHSDRIRNIRLQFTDIQGHMKNVSIPAIQAEKALNDGVWFDGSSIEGFARIEESDMRLVPDPATYAILPSGRRDCREARFICDVLDDRGRPFDGDPRFILKRACAVASNHGFTLNTGPELEFWLLKSHEGDPATRFIDTQGYFDIAPSEIGVDIRSKIIRGLTGMGFEVEASHHEVAPSQHEIAMHYCDALRAADRIITFKYIAKTIALNHGLHATFMAKVNDGINGNALHVHLSLAKDGRNTFYDPDAPMQLSDTALHFVGGLLRHAPAITRIANPTINSYKRLVRGYEAPCMIAWSSTNRSALIRVPAPRGEGTRIEYRSPDAMCNPYLMLAVILASGLDGIEQRIEPPESIEGNIYSISHAEQASGGIDHLPETLMEANQHLVDDPLLCDLLGDHVVAKLTQLAVLESEAFDTAVHPWELERYLMVY